MRHRGVFSAESILSHGVPQGSIFGPLLFSIYTSQMHKCLEFCNVHYYADDTQLYTPFFSDNIPQINVGVNSDLANLVNLSKKHSLCINPDKSLVRLFGRSQERQCNVNRINIVINVGV